MNNQTFLEIDHEKCILCGICVGICPEDALAIEADHLSVIRPEACTRCALCEDICPVGALSLRYEIVWRSIDGK